MRQRFLLDCTLRDGGYINDWEFGHDNIVNIFERVVKSGVDVIEIGFLDDRRPFDINRSIMPDTDSVQRIYGRLDRKNTMVVGMIDYGTCDISHVSDCSDSYLDGIRVIFKKDKMHPAMEFCRQLIAKGYKVFSQLVSVSSYSDDELREVVSLANDIHPYALSMVDTYGLLNPKSLTHIMEVIDQNLDRDICLGFHAHNNFQLGYINAMTVLESDIDRNVLVDGSLYGMGKSAGNAPLELIAMSMNEKFGKNYDVSEMQEAIVTSILDIQKRSPWGYQLFYYIAAANKVHPNYVSYLMNKRTLSVTEINEILQKIPEEEKLSKNMEMIEQMYLDFQKKECDDTYDIKRLADELRGKDILVLGPAPNIIKQKTRIDSYIRQNHPVIISINYIPDEITPDYIFITNNSRYLQLATKLSDHRDIRQIASSNLTRTDGNFDYVVNYSALIDEKAEFPDNSMCMLLRLLVKAGVKKVSLAGFDGYTADSINYYDEDKEYDFLKEKADYLNNYGRTFFKEIADKTEVAFVTDSRYEEAR